MAWRAPSSPNAPFRSVRPWPNPRAINAASGRSTRAPRYVRAMPRRPQRPSGSAARTRAAREAPSGPPEGRGRVPARSTARALTDALALRRLEGGGEGAVRPEDRVAGELVPATQVVGGEQVLHGGQVVRTLRRVGQDDRPGVGHLGEDLLGVRRVQVLHERVGDVLDAMRLRVLV